MSAAPLDYGDLAEAQQLTPTPKTVTIPAGTRLISSNQRLHWRAKARLTAAIRQAVGWAAKPLGPAAGPVNIVAVVHPKTNRRFDPHNYQPTVKAAIDGLVDAGVLTDDNADVVRAVTFVAGPKNAAGWVIDLHIEEVGQ